jgi:glutamate-5-semialdehyde dehydrogenase
MNAAGFRILTASPASCGDLDAYEDHRRDRARASAMAAASGSAKDDALIRIARLIRERRDAMKAANALDVDRARGNGLEPAMVDRLTLNDKAIAQMASGLEQVVQLPDPIGEIIEVRPRPSGIRVGRMRVPLGVM